FKNLFDGIGRHARAVVINKNLDVALQPAASDAHRASRRREGAGVLDEIVHDLTEAGIVPRYLECARPAAFEPERDAYTVVALHFVGYSNQGVEELGEIDRRR